MKSYIFITNAGFTLIELLIVIVIISILGAIAIPSYQNYTHRMYFSEVVQATVPFKTGVEQCYQNKNSKDKNIDCSSGNRGVPPSLKGTDNSIIANIVVAPNGTITATAKKINGLKGETYILTPTATIQADGRKTLSWDITGTCAAAGYC